MKKNELINEFFSSKKHLFALVGPNNSGKSYFIKHSIYNNVQFQSIMYLDETGMYSIKGNRKKVGIVKDYYYYAEENLRGQSGKRKPEFVKINDSSMNIIKTVEEIYNRSNIANKSLGTTKINYIARSLLEYNLNEISFFVFDEPENSLDDERMKYLERIIIALVSNNKNVFFVTHSPRFLELLQIEIDNIYVLPGINKDFIHYNISDIYNFYDSICCDISNKIGNKTEICTCDKLEYKSGTPLSRVQIDLFLKSFDFYKVLFYFKVCIVEGESEEYVLRSLNNKFSSSLTIYKARGKYHIPFLAKLFNSLGINVKCIIDSDTNGKTEKLSIALTHYLKEMEKNGICICQTLTGDLENYLSINFSTAINKLLNENLSSNQSKGFKNSHKAIITYSEIINDENKKNKVLDLLKDDNQKTISKFSNVFSQK